MKGKEKLATVFSLHFTTLREPLCIFIAKHFACFNQTRLVGATRFKSADREKLIASKSWWLEVNFWNLNVGSKCGFRIRTTFLFDLTQVRFHFATLTFIPISYWLPWSTCEQPISIEAARVALEKSVKSPCARFMRGLRNLCEIFN